MYLLRFCLLFVLLTATGCHRPYTTSYKEQYVHLTEPLPKESAFEVPDYYVVFLVAAYHFDYTDYRTTVRTMCKHPSDGGKEGNVGHCWILLHGYEGEKEVCIEGGHSGELGEVQPKYFEGVMNYFKYGYLDPTEEQMNNPRHEPNPIKYLWEVQQDGYFQKGSGNYKPTYAALVPLTKEQYFKIKKALAQYDFKKYSITENQCATMVALVGEQIDLPIEHKVVVPIAAHLDYATFHLRLWEDPYYSRITLSVPDRVECSLMRAVAAGRAIPALKWYNTEYSKKKPASLKERMETVRCFPERFTRYLLLR